MRNRVVLPAPLGPTSPIFSPRFNAAAASIKRMRWLLDLLILSMRIMERGPRRCAPYAMMRCTESMRQDRRVANTAQKMVGERARAGGFLPRRDAAHAA